MYKCTISYTVSAFYNSFFFTPLLMAAAAENVVQIPEKIRASRISRRQRAARKDATLNLVPYLSKWIRKHLKFVGAKERFKTWLLPTACMRLWEAFRYYNFFFCRPPSFTPLPMAATAENVAQIPDVVLHEHLVGSRLLIQIWCHLAKWMRKHHNFVRSKEQFKLWLANRMRVSVKRV